MHDEVVYIQGEYIILKSYRIFGNGFNVYKETDMRDGNGGVIFGKVNPRYQWYSTLEAAKEFLDTLQAATTESATEETIQETAETADSASALEKDRLSPKRYAYLSEEDSVVCDSVKDSNYERDNLIKKLLEDKARAAKHAHRLSPY